MPRPSRRKLVNDLWMAKGRTVLMILAIAVSLFGVGAILSSYGILTREIEVNYRNTMPASATLKIHGVNDKLVAEASARPELLAAEGRAAFLARVKTGPEQSVPMLFLVVKDFTDMRISTFSHEEGAWPPPQGTILIERTTPSVIDSRIGQPIQVTLPSGREIQMPVSGITHDPSLAPAWQEQLGYAYIAQDTLESIGEPAEFDELRILVKDQQLDADNIERIALDIAGDAEGHGYHVEEILIPPPGKHPHQNQMTGILLLFMVFSFLALVLSAILVASMVSSMMAQQIRQIGVMKAIGASTRQISRLYLMMIFLVSSAAIVLALPLGAAAGTRLAEEVSEMLNFTLYSSAIPWWVYTVVAAAGLCVPWLITLRPILRGSQITVREAIHDYGVSQESFRSNAMDSLFRFFPRMDRSLVLALRNSFRRRGRFVLNLVLLAAGGAMFMTGLNISSAWEKDLSQAFEYRHYDLMVQLKQERPVEPMVRHIESISGVERVEAWGYSEASLAEESEIDVAHTYPDGRHGSFSLYGAPAATEMISFPMTMGEWLHEGDSQAIVLNHMAYALVPDAKLGDPITLSVGGKQHTWILAGVMKELGSPAAAYIGSDSFEQTVVGVPGHARSLRVTIGGDADVLGKRRMIDRVVSTLDQLDAGIDIAITDFQLRSAVDEHMSILIFSLISLAVLMAVVGILGLTSSISTSIIERTREIAVMKTIGGTPRMIMRNIVSEGVFIGVLSWFGAVLVSLPLSYSIGYMVGSMAFRSPLPLALSPFAMLIWLLTLVVGSAAASSIPAWRASKQTIREALAVV
jgi:putative ABC transport system permease protein